jgi:putative flavoprotein involved in K+ transport
MTNADVVVIGGGQAGLATAHVAITRGLRPLVLDAGATAGGSWPQYYDSLTLFSPARFSALPGMPFHGDPNRYPVRDEVVDYLTTYTAQLDAPVMFGQRVQAVTRTEDGFQVHTDAGLVAQARAVVAASGGFGRPHRPDIPGLDTFTGTVLHSAEYRSPTTFDGARVVVVGGGNSAVQIAAELAATNRVSIATRSPLRWQPQHILGRDFHWWLARTRLDTAQWAPRLAGGTVPVIDDGRYRTALHNGNPDHHQIFTRIDGNTVHWPDQRPEHLDALILATGYRPDLAYLHIPGALGADGRPAHHGGVSTTVPGLGYVGLERQRSFASATLRGVGRDAAHVLAAVTTPTDRSRRRRARRCRA